MLWPVTLLCLAALLGAHAQSPGQVFNATRVFNLNGTVYSQGGSLLPVGACCYSIYSRIFQTLPILRASKPCQLYLQSKACLSSDRAISMGAPTILMWAICIHEMQCLTKHLHVQQHFNLYNIPVPSNYSDPDILLTLNSTTGGTGLALYCNPQYGQFASASSSYPGPGYAVWSSGQPPYLFSVTLCMMSRSRCMMRKKT